MITQHLLHTFLNSPVKQKLTLIMMFITSAAVLLTCAAFITYDIRATKQSMINELSMIAQIIGKRTAPGMQLPGHENAEKAKQNLADLQSNRAVVLACLYRNDGSMLADYKQKDSYTCPRNVPETGHYYREKTLIIHQTINDINSNNVGSIYIVADMRDIDQHLRQFMIGIAFLLSAVLFFAYLIINKLQRIFTIPIQTLANTMQSIIQNGDYSARTKKIYDDELGKLVSIFNQMLFDIQRTDSTLKESNAALIHANKLKDTWISNIGHEIRTPVHALLQISGFALAECQKENPGIVIMNELWGREDRYARRLCVLIDDLLDFQKMQAGKSELKLKQANLEKVIRGMVDELNPQSNEKNITITVHSITCDTDFTFDKVRMSQVITNIIANAIKFTPKGGTIEVSTTAAAIDDEHPDGVAVSIKDCGVGIPLGEEETIFDTFTQSSKTYTGAGGTGLGLSISRELIKLHHGRIFAKNNEGEPGATFTFIIPRYQPNKEWQHDDLLT